MKCYTYDRQLASLGDEVLEEVVTLQIKDIDKLYNTIFDESFLIQYGYYDVKMKKTSSYTSIDEHFDEQYGEPESFYLKLFNLSDFKKLDDLNYLRTFYSFSDISKNVDTEAIYFNIPKSNYIRREYKMPNLYSYLELVFFLVDNKNNFINLFKTNKYSTSKFFNVLDFNFTFTKKIESRLLFGGTNILSLDLSNFYHTLYTHSIPWVIEGKQNSKRNRINGFANNLDKIIQHCQYGETHGIPTGNICTKIIAEFYMCYIDKQLEEKNFKYSRYVDDIKFPYTSDSERESFMMEITNLCREYNLILNDRKTEINSFPFENNKQKIEIFSYFDNLSIKSKKSTWIKRITEFLEYCLSEESNKNKGAIKCLFSVPINKFNSLKISRSLLNDIFIFRERINNFNLFEQFLDVSLKDSRLTNRFIHFTEQLIVLGVKKNQLKNIAKRYCDENKDLLRNRLLTSKNNGWNQEVYQILLYAVIFDKNSLITKKILREVLESELDDYSMCLSLILWIKKGLKSSDLLSILEDKLTKVHNTYAQDSVRMQEKYWLLRYFVYYLIDQQVIPQNIVQNHFKSYRTKKGRIISELCTDYVLDTSSVSKERKEINKFYSHLLSNNIALVHLGQNKKFDYL